MEDPVTFDVYGIVRSEATQSAAEFLEKSGTYPTRLEAFKSANVSAHSKVPVLLLHAVPWSVANEFQDTASWASEVEKYQAGYSAKDRCSYCEVHKLHYGGVLKCHVCVGTYVR